MDGALVELSRQLLGCADAELLDTPLDVSCSAIAEPDARELLIAAYEAGFATRLRDLLADQRLARWAAERCTAREEASLCAQLTRWLGDGRAPDDPTRLVAAPRVPEQADELTAWIAEHGLARTFARPAREVLPSAAGLPAHVRVGDCCLARVSASSSSLLEARTLELEARAELAREAAHQAALAARAELHRAPLPDDPLGLLARRLLALFERTPLADLHAFRFVAARPVELAAETGTCRAALREQARVISLTIQLSGFEQRALRAECSACEQACVHVAALAARLFEACMHAEDRLHAALRAFAEVPSWRRFVRALEPASAPATTSRLYFSLRCEGSAVSVGCLVRRTLADGRSSPGKLVSAQSQLRGAHVSDRDRALLDAIAARARVVSPQYVPAELAVLRGLVEHPAVELDGDGPWRVVEESAHVELLEQPEGLTPRVTLAGEALALRHCARDARHALCLQRAQRTLFFCALTPALIRLLTALEHFHGVLPEASYPELAAWLGSLHKSARVSLPRALLGRERPPPKRLLLRITPGLDEGLDVALCVRALPLAPLWSPGEGPELVHGLVDGVHSSVRRDLEHERAAARELIGALALDDKLALAPHAFRLESTEDALTLLSRAARRGEQLELEWAERARPLRIAATVRSASLSVALFKHGDWCTLAGGVELGERLVPIERLLEAARNGERFVPIAGDDYAEIEEALFDRLARAQLCTLPRMSGRALSTAAVPALHAELGPALQPGDDAARALLARAAGDEPAYEPTLPGLRDYQKHGVAWMVQRSRWAPGVCLADEMGLGKTVQTIAVLAERAAGGPALVLAPTSVVDNWLRELKRFAPGLSGHAYRGAKRHALLATLGPGAVLVASYELLLRDRARFDELAFATLVIDEAQWLKNARTLRARAVATLRTEFRIALTGTPIENRLADLWSLYHLLAPGLLGSWAQFRARFAVPIERYENSERAAALRALCAPLLLRRQKLEVASELPTRTEVVHLIELAPAERDLYAAALAHARRAYGKRKRHPDDAARRVQLLAELTRLRQLACHPRLVLEDARVSSSKLRALVQLLEDIVPRGHRVLVFSQFVRHLALVREAVAELGLRALYLDGRTPPDERTRAVDAFQRGEAPLFLISLKAGGTGLNLTAADYVIHLDPWWNPSVEDQASDRAHRIGQRRPVTIVKLVAQGTIEERVLHLHAHKRRLARVVVDEASPSREPSTDELAALLND